MDELLKAISQNPELIDSYTAEQVEEARSALKDFTAQVKAGEIEADSEALSEAKALTEKLTERETAITAETEARASEIAELESALGIEAEVEEVEDEPEEEIEVIVVEETPEAELEKIVEEETELVAAAKPTTGKLASKIPAERKPRDVKNSVSLVASAEGFARKDVLTASAYGEMVNKAWRGLPNVSRQTTFHMGEFSMEGQHKYSVKPGDNDGNARALAAIARDAEEEGNLVASGGFCAPAEQLYDFFNIASRAGILNLPTVNAPRGSISLPVSPSFGDFFGESGIAFEWTNENDIGPSSPATKPVYVFECPDFQDCEVSAWPTILQFGNFAARFYPEAIANATGLAMIAADRTVNAARIAYLRAAATTVAATNTLGGGLISLARNVSEAATFYRQTYAMSPDAVLDLVVPAWVPRALYVDALARDSSVDYGDLRRRVRGIFDEIDVRPQFVYDLDDGATVATAWDGTADFLLMAPGTVVELDGGTLDLGVVRDSTLNATNDFQTFAEPFVGWCQPGHEVMLLNDVPICSSGATGDRVTVVC